MLEFLIDKIFVSFGGALIYLSVKSKALASWIFLSFTRFWRNSDSYENKNKSAKRGAQFVPIGCSKETIYKVFNPRNDGSKCVVLGYNSTYILNKIRKGKTCYSEEQVISMLEFTVTLN
jgi:hypothetical protein